MGGQGGNNKSFTGGALCGVLPPEGTDVGLPLSFLSYKAFGFNIFNEKFPNVLLFKKSSERREKNIMNPHPPIMQP